MKPVLYDEVGNIRDVFVHQPGLECIVACEAEDPSMWLFDPALKGVNGLEWLKAAQHEHFQYTQLLQQRGIRVHNLTDLLRKQKVVLRSKLEEALNSAEAQNLVTRKVAQEFRKLMEINVVDAALQGVTMGFEDYSKLAEAGLSLLIPKPNAYFTQDPFAIIGDHFVRLVPATWQRSGEPELWEIALQPNPSHTYSMRNIGEGGDITIADRKVFVGIGTRTTAEAAQEIFRSAHRFRYINGVLFVFKPDAATELGINHSSNLPYIHLDTIWTPDCVGNTTLMQACVLWHSHNGNGQLKTLLDYSTNQGRIVPASEKEQYSLAPNVLIANGAVISADVNVETNEAMANAGLHVKTFPAKTLLGGSGSGHCMSNVANYIL